MRKLLSYLMRDKVDLIFLVLTIEFTILFFIKTPVISEELAKTGNFSMWLPVVCLFILGSTMWTKGLMTDLMKQYIKDPEARKKLHLDPIPKSTGFDRMIEIFFLIFWIIAFIFVFIILLRA